MFTGAAASKRRRVVDVSMKLMLIREGKEVKEGMNGKAINRLKDVKR